MSLFSPQPQNGQPQLQQPTPGAPELVWTGERLQKASIDDLCPTAEEKKQRFLHNVLNKPNIRPAIKSLLLQPSSSTCRDYSIQLRGYDILNNDPLLGQMLLRYPAALIPYLEDAIVEAQKEMLKELDEEEEVPMASVKGETSGQMTRVHAALTHLPPSRFKASLSRLEAKDVGEIWQVTGTVVRAGPIQMYESQRKYLCKASKKGGCGQEFTIRANLESYNNSLTLPSSCPHTLANGKKCGGTQFVAAEGETGLLKTDYQEIKIQESSSASNKIGHIPRSLLVKLTNDLVDLCQPGDEVVIVGTLQAMWQTDVASLNRFNSNPADAPEPDIGLSLLAHSIVVLSNHSSSAMPSKSGSVTVDDTKKYLEEFIRYWQEPVNRENPILARDFICRAVCPKLYGLPVIKLALLLTLVGGVSQEAYEENRGNNSQDAERGGNNQSTLAERNQPNDLFVLKPGKQAQNKPEPSQYDLYRTENNQLQNATDGSSSAQVYTRRRSQSHLLLVGDPGTGKSQFLRFAAALSPRSVLTTGVGTTSAGLTCAAVRHGKSGEFALEAGALVLADQGVCCIDEFGCIRDADRTTIHEAMEQQHLSVAKAGIVCKLNSRATIVAVMNPRDCLYDNMTSLSANTGLGTPLLSRFDLIFKMIDTSNEARDDKITSYLLNQSIHGERHQLQEETDEKGDSKQTLLEPWPMEKLRSYIATVKERFCPTLSNDAAQLLERHYEACRASNSRTIPVTVRFLESLIRLSQAHARLLFRNSVELIDAVAVIRVMECSAFCYGGFDCPQPYELDNNGNQHLESIYSDPMIGEFSSVSDLDLLVFEYRLLERYRMLDKMTSELRDQAFKELQNRQPQQPARSNLDHHVYAAAEEANWNTDKMYQQQDFYGRSWTQTQGDSRKRKSYGESSTD